MSPICYHTHSLQVHLSSSLTYFPLLTKSTLEKNIMIHGCIFRYEILCVRKCTHSHTHICHACLMWTFCTWWSTPAQLPKDTKAPAQCASENNVHFQFALMLINEHFTPQAELEHIAELSALSNSIFKHLIAPQLERSRIGKTPNCLMHYTI